MASVERITSVQNRELLVVYMGIDDHDNFYDNDQTRKRITALFHKSGIIYFNAVSLPGQAPPNTWSVLAENVVQDGCSF